MLVNIASFQNNTINYNSVFLTNLMCDLDNFTKHTEHICTRYVQLLLNGATYFNLVDSLLVHYSIELNKTTLRMRGNMVDIKPEFIISVLDNMNNNEIDNMVSYIFYRRINMFIMGILDSFIRNHVSLLTERTYMNIEIMLQYYKVAEESVNKKRGVY